MRKFIFLVVFTLLCARVTAQMQNIGGIGAQLILDSAGGYTMPRIFALVPNSPAYQSLNATDYIVKVGDVSCKDKTIEEVVALIRGEAGTKVKITTSPTKDGKKAKDTLLERVNMQVAGQPAPPDPATAFYASCENEVQQLRKNHVEVIKTFNSECGSYFFNFNAEAGSYRIRVFTMEEKARGVTTPSFTTSGKVYDGDNEAGAISLIPTPAADKGSWMAAQLDGSVTFGRSCVGVISIGIQDEAKKCKAMYIIVYK